MPRTSVNPASFRRRTSAARRCAAVCAVMISVAVSCWRGRRCSRRGIRGRVDLGWGGIGRERRVAPPSRLLPTASRLASASRWTGAPVVRRFRRFGDIGIAAVRHRLGQRFRRQSIQQPCVAWRRIWTGAYGSDLGDWSLQPFGRQSGGTVGFPRV